MTTLSDLALFSSDGAQWQTPKGALTWPTAPRDRVTKIVIGQPPRPGEDPRRTTLAAALPAEFATLFPRLTHLHLWQIEDLKTLPSLPPHLKCLDVRGCPALARLPDLPDGLETLDLGQCTALERLPSPTPAKLTRLYFNGCSTLKSHHLAVFLEDAAARAPGLVEIDASDNRAVTSLELFPRQNLKKLRLNDCPALDDIRALSQFPVLEHLNLSNCGAIRELPALPATLRYLALHGADNLTLFRGQDIGPYDRGAEGENVARIFRSRAKFGAELAVMPHAKLLLLGDGRVGKSTLAKRLQWEELTPAQRQDRNYRGLEPSKSEAFTHRVQFGRWETGLTLPDEELRNLEQRAAAAGVTLPKTSAGHLDGAIRLWDFGGQEIYHGTHRIFAGEGSIFLLVWREHPPEIGAPLPDVTPEEWQEWNDTRSLDYWLDYIDSIRPHARIALVCTHCEDPDRRPNKPDWRTRAPKHRDRDLPMFFVDSLDANCGQHSEYQRLVGWIREACGREARRIGILQPRFYRQVSDRLDEWLLGNVQARERGEPPPHGLCAWSDWDQRVREAYSTTSAHAPQELDDDDVATITEYLHEAGHLFHIRHESQRAVLIDQDWAAELIYQMLLSGGPLRKTVKGRGGWFYRLDLENEPHWKSLEDNVQRGRLLEYMEECRIVTRIGTADQQASRQDVFLATDKWLLPKYEDVEQQVDGQLRTLRDRPSFVEQRKFEFTRVSLSEFDFRGVLAHVARFFGTNATYFRNGLQAHAPGISSEWCFRLRWQPEAGDPFAGRIDAVLVASTDHLPAIERQVEELLLGDGSSLASHRPRVERRAADPRDLRHDYFRGLRPDEYDVAVSNSGQDHREAAALVQSLIGAGLNVNHYRRPECRLDEREKVHNFMLSLGKQPCIVLVLSDAYLKDDPTNNWYCAWELADAVIRMSSDDPRESRAEARTIAVYKLGGTLTSSNLNARVVTLFESMGKFFADAYAGLHPRERGNFTYYDDISRHFYRALEAGRCERFFRARGTLGAYHELPADVERSDAWKPIVHAVKKSLAPGDVGR